jgi:signal transduction histidine kinase
LVLATAGTGLGLSIVKSVIEMHDGRLWAESEGVGRGSTFTFLVPLAE